MVKRIAHYSTGRPLQTSLVLSTAYILLCGLYIWISGHLAASSAGDVATLERIEWFKGTMFILATGILFFAFSYLMLNRMSHQSNELLHKKNALIVADRRAMAGAIALSIAHDLNNQIMVIRAGLEELTESESPAQQPTIQYVKRAVDDMARLSKQLLNMGRDTMVEDFQYFDLRELLNGVIELASRHHHARDCDIVTTIRHDLHVRLNPSVISQMLFNLIINAADAMGGKGKIEVRAIPQGKQIVIEVHDAGPGIPAEMRVEVMKPFFTTKKTGHGLGFMAVMACVEVHNGKMEITESDLGGACIRISMPIT